MPPVTVHDQTPQQFAQALLQHDDIQFRIANRPQFRARWGKSLRIHDGKNAVPQQKASAHGVFRASREAGFCTFSRYLS